MQKGPGGNAAFIKAHPAKPLCFKKRNPKSVVRSIKIGMAAHRGAAYHNKIRTHYCLLSFNSFTANTILP